MSIIQIQNGEKYGRLKVISEAPKMKGGHRASLCECECGNFTIIRNSGLMSGHNKSCGCFLEEERKRFIENASKKIEWIEEPCRYIDLGNCFVCISHSVGTDGYTQYDWDHKHNHMSRFIWEQMHGEIPSKMQVCHKCDNPKCINPEHFFLGTTQENTKDKVKKDRQNKGESHGMSKLWNNAIIEILKSTGSYSQIAQKYNVSPQAIFAVKTRKTWRHVTI